MGARPGPQRGRIGKGKADGEGGKRDVDEEHRPPVDVLGEQPTQDRAERREEGGGAGHDAEARP